MQLTRAADYGVRLMVHLARLPRDRRASRAELAQAADAPGMFVSKILQRLASSQLIVSHAGRGGGFTLAAPGDRISMLDVITAIEGPLCLNVCLIPGDTCPRKPWCAAHLVWVEAQARMAPVLAAASVASLARRSAVRRARFERARGAARTHGSTTTRR